MLYVISEFLRKEFYLGESVKLNHSTNIFLSIMTFFPWPCDVYLCCSYWTLRLIAAALAAKIGYFQLNKISKTLNSRADSLLDLDCLFHIPSQHLHHLDEFLARPSQVWFSGKHQAHPFHSDIFPSPQFLRNGHAFQNFRILLSQNNVAGGAFGFVQPDCAIVFLAGVSQYWNLFPSDHSAWKHS